MFAQIRQYYLGLASKNDNTNFISSAFSVEEMLQLKFLEIREE